jgi:hypothetical protein
MAAGTAEHRDASARERRRPLRREQWRGAERGGTRALPADPRAGVVAPLSPSSRRASGVTVRASARHPEGGGAGHKWQGGGAQAAAARALTCSPTP